MVKPKGKLETEKILDLVSQMRTSIPEKYRAKPKPRPSEDTRMADITSADDFEVMAVADALGQLADELHESIELANAKLLQDCLNVYYATEELVKDPANAHLIPHLEAMRKAYEDSYGHPIPPKKQG